MTSFHQKVLLAAGSSSTGDATLTKASDWAGLDVDNFFIYNKGTDPLTVTINSITTTVEYGTASDEIYKDPITSVEIASTGTAAYNWGVRL